MSSQNIKLSAEPVQLTNGSETAYVSCGGIFYFADSASKPADLSVCHVASQLTINPPYQIWAWSGAPGVTITISKQSA